MSPFHPLWIEHQRKRFTRPDAYRLAPPGTPESKPPGWLDPSATRVRLKEAQEDEARALEAARQEELERDFLELRWLVKSLRTDLLVRGVGHKYRPDQPRDELGRWTDAGGDANAAASDAAAPSGPVLSDETPDPIRPGAQYAQGDRLGAYPVDLREEEARGGHTIEKHVNRSPEALVGQVREEFGKRPDARDARSGSFTSLEAATKLVNSTLAQNRDTIERIASGLLPTMPVFSQFDSVTGMEAVAAHIGSGISFRETYGVGVIAVRDPSSPRGYTVWTAFPSNGR